MVGALTLIGLFAPTAGMLPRALAIMTAAAATSSVLFSFTTNGNAQLLTERLSGVAEDPALLGNVSAVASLAQLVVGGLIGRMATPRVDPGGAGAGGLQQRATLRLFTEEGTDHD